MLTDFGLPFEEDVSKFITFIGINISLGHLVDKYIRHSGVEYPSFDTRFSKY